jgi:hypothetical protein
MAHLKQADLPEIPAGSTITVEETADGLHLQWLNPWGEHVRGVIFFLTIWLAGWAVFAVFAVARVIRDVQRASTLDRLLLFWLCIWLVAGGFISYVWWRLIAPAKPEVLILGGRELRHRAGTPRSGFSFATCSLKVASKQFSRFRSQLRRPTETAADKSAVGKPLLEPVGEHQRLTVDIGADRIEIGEFLRGPEREWLAQVLQLWFAER